MICFLDNFFTVSVFVLYFFYFYSYLLIRMEESSRENRLSSIESKPDFLIHHLDPRIHNDSLMEQGVLTHTFQDEEELSSVKKHIFFST